MRSLRTHATPRTKKRRQSSAVRPAPSAVEQDEPDRSEDRGNRMMIVGVGASAGGLEAITQFMNQQPIYNGKGYL